MSLNPHPDISPLRSWISLLPGASQPHRYPACRMGPIKVHRGDLWPAKGPAPLLRSLTQVASQDSAMVEIPQQDIPGPRAATDSLEEP